MKAAKAAIEPLKLVPLDADSGRLMHAEDVDALRAFKRPKDPQYALVSGLDALVLHRRDVTGLSMRRTRRDRSCRTRPRSRPASLTDLPSHGIFDRGRLIGLWEYDHGRSDDRVGDVRREGQGADRGGRRGR